MGSRAASLAFQALVRVWPAGMSNSSFQSLSGVGPGLVIVKLPLKPLPQSLVLAKAAV